MEKIDLEKFKLDIIVYSLENIKDDECGIYSNLKHDEHKDMLFIYGWIHIREKNLKWTPKINSITYVRGKFYISFKSDRGINWGNIKNGGYYYHHISVRCKHDFTPYYRILKFKKIKKRLKI